MRLEVKRDNCSVSQVLDQKGVVVVWCPAGETPILAKGRGV